MGKEKTEFASEVWERRASHGRVVHIKADSE
jgi:hypothetical protein